MSVAVLAQSDGLTDSGATMRRHLYVVMSLSFLILLLSMSKAAVLGIAIDDSCVIQQTKWDSGTWDKSVWDGRRDDCENRYIVDGDGNYIVAPDGSRIVAPR